MVIGMRLIEFRREQHGVGRSQGYDGISAAKGNKLTSLEIIRPRLTDTHASRAKDRRVAGLSPVRYAT